MLTTKLQQTTENKDGDDSRRRNTYVHVQYVMERTTTTYNNKQMEYIFCNQLKNVVILLSRESPASLLCEVGLEFSDPTVGAEPIPQTRVSRSSSFFYSIHRDSSITINVQECAALDLRALTPPSSLRAYKWVPCPSHMILSTKPNSCALSGF